MGNYIKADMNRIMHRKTRWIFFGILVFVSVITMLPDKNMPQTGVGKEADFELILKYLPKILAIIELPFVFGDDFKAKASQIAIGVGVSRHQIVFAKWFNMLLCYLMDIAAYCLITLVMAQFTPAPIPPELYSTIVIEVLMSVVNYLAFTSLILPILFASQGINTAMLVYLMLQFGAVDGLLNLLSNLVWFPIRHIDDYSLTACVGIFKSQLLIGEFSAGRCFGILVYTAIGLIAAIKIYKNRELEF